MYCHSTVMTNVHTSEKIGFTKQGDIYLSDQTFESLPYIPSVQEPHQPDPRLIALFHEVHNAIINDTPILLNVGGQICITRMDLKYLWNAWKHLGTLINKDSSTEDGERNQDMWLIIGDMLSKKNSSYREAFQQMEQQEGNILIDSNSGWKTTKNPSNPDGYVFKYKRTTE